MKRDELYRKSNQEIIEVTQAAIEGGDVKHLGLNAGTFPPPGRGHEEYAELVSEIKTRFDIFDSCYWFGVQGEYGCRH